MLTELVDVVAAVVAAVFSASALAHAASRSKHIYSCHASWYVATTQKVKATFYSCCIPKLIPSQQSTLRFAPDSLTVFRFCPLSGKVYVIYQTCSRVPLLLGIMSCSVINDYSGVFVAIMEWSSVLDPNDPNGLIAAYVVT